MKKFIRLISAVVLAGILFLLPSSATGSKASGDTDAIRLYEINVSVNEDATLHMEYHFLWEVLESDGIGPLSWVLIGMPNDSIADYDVISDNISDMYPDNSQGNYMRVDFDREYYEGETIDFSFYVEQDNMYVVDELIEGESRFTFTPGWFDEIAIDELVIRWNSENVVSQNPACLMDGGNYVWKTSLAKGATTTVQVSYPNDAYFFDMSKTEYYYPNPAYNDIFDNYSYNSNSYNNYYDDYYEDYYEDDNDGVGIAIAFFVIILMMYLLFKAAASYLNGSGFSSGETTKKVVKRTLIKYYPSCPGCGAVRKADQQECEYCGRSFIESEEVIEEKDVVDPEKYSSEGLYSYGGSSDTYIRVHVTPVVVHSHRGGFGGGLGSGGHSSCAHSSCAHSSCACASHCACACACACAGGGRAGCSTKDFYNTNLKLRQLERKTQK